MTPPDGTFWPQVIAWLRDQKDPRAETHGKTLADRLEELLREPHRDPEWRLSERGDWALNREQFLSWMWRNEHAGMYCSPPWTRNFSKTVGAYVFADKIGKQITFVGYEDSKPYEAWGTAFHPNYDGGKTKVASPPHDLAVEPFNVQASLAEGFDGDERSLQAGTGDFGMGAEESVSPLLDHDAIFGTKVTKEAPVEIRPNYYKAEAKLRNHDGEVRTVECFDMIEALRFNYYLGDAFKYLWRLGRKNGLSKREDLRKSITFLQQELARMDRDGEP